MSPFDCKATLVATSSAPVRFETTVPFGVVEPTVSPVPKVVSSVPSVLYRASAMSRKPDVSC